MTKVTYNNFYIGLKVIISEDSMFRAQARGSLYGIITDLPSTPDWVKVAWYSKDGKELGIHDYHIGSLSDNSRLDLCFYKEPVDPVIILINSIDKLILKLGGTL